MLDDNLSTAVTNSDVKIFRVRVREQLDPNIQPFFLIRVLKRDTEMRKIHLEFVWAFSHDKTPMSRDGIFEFSLEVRYLV